MRLDSDIVTLSSVSALRTATPEKAAGGKAPAAAAATSAADRVELSIGKNQLDRLKQTADSEPAFRSDKVAALRQQIADGSYQVAAGDVAGKLADWLR